MYTFKCKLTSAAAKITAGHLCWVNITPIICSLCAIVLIFFPYMFPCFKFTDSTVGKMCQNPNFTWKSLLAGNAQGNCYRAFWWICTVPYLYGGEHTNQDESFRTAHNCNKLTSVHHQRRKIYWKERNLTPEFCLTGAFTLLLHILNSRYETCLLLLQTYLTL